jgi:hypothetical protein
MSSKLMRRNGWRFEYQNVGADADDQDEEDGRGVARVGDRRVQDIGPVLGRRDLKSIRPRFRRDLKRDLKPKMQTWKVVISAIWNESKLKRTVLPSTSFIFAPKNDMPAEIAF